MQEKARGVFRDLRQLGHHAGRDDVLAFPIRAEHDGQPLLRTPVAPAETSNDSAHNEQNGEQD